MTNSAAKVETATRRTRYGIPCHDATHRAATAANAGGMRMRAASASKVLETPSVWARLSSANLNAEYAAKTSTIATVDGSGRRKPVARPVSDFGKGATVAPLV